MTGILSTLFHSSPAKAERSLHPVESLQTQWKTAIGLLKRSGLKKKGNPLYVLPWYLVMGPTGSGKTSAIRNAGLSTFLEPMEPKPITSTAHCEFSFFDTSVVVDTSGRYVTMADSSKENSEWASFTRLLKKYRSRESLNGLIVMMSANELSRGAGDSLKTTGKVFRRRIDQLMQTLGTRFPVYVMVTQCDTLPGFSRWSQSLSSFGRQQAMGCLNERSQGDEKTFLANTFSILGERLKNVRNVLMSTGLATPVDPALLVLPEAFAQLHNGLGSFMEGIYQENLYQETPLLRGLYFSAESAFLHDFFAKVLPGDRAVVNPTNLSLGRLRGKFKLSLISWMLTLLLILGLLSYSFAKNMKVLGLLRDAHQEYMQLPGAQINFENAVLAMERYDLTLSALDHQTWTSAFSGMGLRDVAHVDKTLRDMLINQFKRDVLTPADLQLATTCASLTSSSSDEQFSEWVGYLVSRLTVLRKRLEGADLATLQKTRPVIPVLRMAGHAIDQDTREKIGSLYVDSVFWSSDSDALQQERVTLEALLKKLLTVKGRDPRWLIVWAAEQIQIPPTTLAEDWHGRLLSRGWPFVPGLFSIKGKSLIDSFFKEIEKALNDPAAFTDLKAHFEQWYWGNSFDVWHRYLEAFPKGQEALSNADSWRQAAARMSAEDGPYFALLQHLVKEFDAVAPSDLPVWLKHVRQLRDLQKLPAFWKYRQALEKVAKAAANPTQVTPITAQAFDPQATVDSSAFTAAFEALTKLKTAVPKEVLSDAPVWKLISGPLEFLWDHARRETAAHLQADWESKVLSQATGLDAAQALPVLLAKEGPAVRFAKEQAGPFVQWKPDSGFSPKAVFGGAIPFTGAFFSFLNGAVWVSSVNDLHIGITALTPETNAKAKRIPHITRLTLRCGGAKDQVLSNRRLRVIEKTFNEVDASFAWTPACSETILEIDVAGNRLIKSYPGPFGFFAFLHDFKNGTHTFYRKEFPEQAKDLTELSVETITLHYRLKGAPDFAAPKAAPAKIAWEWN